MKPLSDDEWKDAVANLLTQISNCIAFKGYDGVSDDRIRGILEATSALNHDVLARKRLSDF